MKDITVQGIKIVIDTNVWISILIGKRLSNLIPLFDNGKVRIVTSYSLLSELSDVMSRKKFRKYFQEDDVKPFLNHIVLHSYIYIINKVPSLCRDPKDDYLLELSKQSNADYLVTGDDDLLVLKTIGNTAIVSPSDFQKRLEVL